jgi:hypothetical protein
MRIENFLSKEVASYQFRVKDEAPCRRCRRRRPILLSAAVKE